MPSAFPLPLPAALVNAGSRVPKATETRFLPWVQVLRESQIHLLWSSVLPMLLMLPRSVHSPGGCRVVCPLFVPINPLPPALLLLTGGLLPRSRTSSCESKQTCTMAWVVVTATRRFRMPGPGRWQGRTTGLRPGSLPRTTSGELEVGLKSGFSGDLSCLGALQAPAHQDRQSDTL